MTTIDNKFVQKCISDLKSVGISFEIDQEEIDIFGVYGEFLYKRKLENVIFRKGKSELKVWNYLFFRGGGICCITETKNSNKKKEENFVKLHIVTDEEFYEMKKQQYEWVLNEKENPTKKEN